MPAGPGPRAIARLLAATWGPVEVSDLSRLTGGASAETWALTAVTAQARTPLILRRAAGEERFALANPKAVEAACQIAASASGVPVAKVLAAFNDAELGEGYLMHRVDGETRPQRILKDPTLTLARAQLTAQCGRALAQLHATPCTEIPGLKVLQAQAQLDALEQIYRLAEDPLPVFELVLRWLREHAPANAAPALVHGDFRHGNFVVDASGLVAVLDWELSHIGDPMEDLGWLCMNAWRFGAVTRPVGGFGTRAELYAAYEGAGGGLVDSWRVRYWELLGCFKWGVICQFQAWNHLTGRVQSLERAVIGRRVSEAEIDMLACLKSLHEQEN